MDYSKIDFNSILGETDKHGHWLPLAEHEENEDQELPLTDITEDNMYVFEGVDYRGAAKKVDIDLFDRLITNDENVDIKGASSSHQRTTERAQRRQMTEEEKAARAAKIRETKAQRQKEMVRLKDYLMY